MRVRALFLALLLNASLVWCADESSSPKGEVELHTLKGVVVKGRLESITDKEIVFTQNATRVATPLAQVLKIDFPDAKAVKAAEPYADVELIDGSLFHCKEWTIKEKQVELKTLAGQEIKLPLAAVANILANAQDEKHRKEWTARLSRKRRRDVVAMLKEGTVNPIEGTLGDADAEGKTIAFQLAGGPKRNVILAKLHGLIFQRELDPNAPPVLCKLSDTHGDFLMVSALTKTPDGLAVTTSAGVKLDVPLEVITGRLDYTLDKIVFLSQVDPAKVVQTSNFGFIDTYRRDKNLDNGPLRIQDEVYPNGLALHAHTELEYDLRGDYREFHAIAGIDQSVGGVGGPVVLAIEGVIDGETKELYKKIFTRKDARDKNNGIINLNIKDVQKLRIIVRSGDLFDNGKHLDLVNAKVQK